ncbi:MAG: hypothetical protein J7K98_03470 [Candidatus Aenigmarchaeota archaeon]|nr:hypothetical protein [Candidatus Aenigmarchaeota archaeon]
MLFERFVWFFQRFGFLDFYFPFLLTFSIFYALLKKTNPFGSKKGGSDNWANNIYVLISFIMAFYVIGYTPVGYKLSQFLMPFFTQTAIALIGLLGISLIWGIVEERVEEPTDYVKKIGWIFFLLAGIYIFYNSGGFVIFNLASPNVGIPGIGLSWDDIFFIILIIVTLLIVAMVGGWKPKISGGGGEQQQPGGQEGHS